MAEKHKHIHMKRNIFFSLATLMAVSIIFLTSCGIGTTDKEANKEAADSIKKELTLTPEAKNLLYALPTPFEVSEMLKNAQAGYIFDITNPVENVDKYMTEQSKAINLGIYSADLAYSATYNQIDNTNKFLGCTSKLANELGIAGVYQPNLVEKIKEFNNNKDSLVELVSDIFNATNDFLSKNNRNQVSVYIATGAFIEGLYLASSLNIVAKDNTQISEVILKQGDNYTKMMMILDLYQDDPGMKSVYDKMFKLKSVFAYFVQQPGKPLSKEKSFEINDLIEHIRNSFIQ